MNYVQILSCNSNIGNCCSDSGIVSIIDVARNVVNLVQLIAPILLIIMASIQFTKMVMNPDRKDGLKNIKNMFHAALFIFFVPMAVNILLSIMPQSFVVADCWQQAKVVAESSRNADVQYISPYDEKDPTQLITDPSEYEKGKPKENGGGGNLGPGDASGILAGAEKVHTVYEQNSWAYYNDLNQLRWNDIKYSTNNPSHMTCCATFVGSAFYVGGVFSESEINKYNYNSVFGINDLCEAHGWGKVTSYSQLQAGDIVMMSGPEGGSSLGHVQIYAGNGTWYNAGSTGAVQRDSPYSGDASGRFLYAWRKTK